MPAITATLISYKDRGRHIHTFPAPVSRLISVGPSYMLGTSDVGAVLTDTQTQTEYVIQESEAIVAALLEADIDVNVTNTSLDVFAQTGTTPTLIADFSKKVAETTTNGATAIDDHDVVVTDATGFVVGQHVTILNVTSVRYFFGHITNIVTNTITIDTPLDFAFPSGSPIVASSDQMAVDGSSTPQIFGIRGLEGVNEVPIEIDVTRIIFTCIAATTVDLSKFGDLTELTNGLVCRYKDGTYSNVFNIHSNGDLANIAYDWTPYVSTNPNQGVDGFVARLTWGGQSKMGVSIRLAAGEDLEMIVQDDLTGLTSLKIIAEGAVVGSN